MITEMGSISGKVMQNDGLTPVSKGKVQVYSSMDSVVFRESVIALDGTYSIKSLKPGKFTVGVSAPGFMNSERKSISVLVGETASDVDFRLLRAGFISGKVTGIDGVTPVKGALVIARQIGGDVTRHAKSKPDGTYLINDLKEGSYRVDVSYPGFVFTFKSNVSVKSAQSIPTVNFSIGKGSAISGKVTEVDGVTPIAEARIIGFVKNGIKKLARTNPDGTYIIEDLPADTYRMMVMRGGYFTARKEDIIVKSEQATSSVNFSLQKTK